MVAAAAAAVDATVAGEGEDAVVDDDDRDDDTKDAVEGIDVVVVVDVIGGGDGDVYCTVGVDMDPGGEVVIGDVVVAVEERRNNVGSRFVEESDRDRSEKVDTGLTFSVWST